jgi:hypothetical protein
MKYKLILLLLILAPFSYAQNWTGSVNNDWNNPSNWSAWPLNGQNITINPAFYSGNSLHPVISANSVFVPGFILLDNGGVLTISANLTTSDDVEVLGTGSSLIINNGTFSVNTGNGGRLIIDLGSTMVINGGATIVGERFIAGSGAVITIHNGTVSSGERLLMDEGGKIIQYDGQVSVAQTFAMADGSLLNNSGYILHGGILNISGEMALENELGNFEPFFIQTGGALNVNGDIIWFGAQPGTGTPKFIQEGGTATITGNIQNLPLSTVNLHIELKDSAIFHYNGMLIETLLPMDSIIQSGVATMHFNNTMNFQNMGVFHASGGTTRINGNASLMGSGSYQFHHIEIEPSKTLLHLNPASIKIAGDILFDGTFQSNLNTIILNGDHLQLLSGTTSPQFNNLTIENTSTEGVHLSVSSTIAGHLQLNTGKVTPINASQLSVLDDATASPGSAMSYIQGPMIKTGDDAFVFPVGKDGKVMHLSINPQTGNPGQFKAEYFNTAHPSLSPVNLPLTFISNLEYWSLELLSGTTAAQVGISWEDASYSLFADCNEVSLAQWGVNGWNAIPSVVAGSCAGSGSGSVASSASLNAFSFFTFGFQSGVHTQNLSICFGDSVMVGTNVYKGAGQYVDIFQIPNSADSILITNLLVNPVYLVTENRVICQGDAYHIGNNTYTVTGIYTDSFQTVFGCDSIVTTDLLVHPVHQVMNPQEICAGDFYTVGTSIYSSAGIFSDTLMSSTGCDSIVITDLFVHPVHQVMNPRQICAGDIYVIGNSTYAATGVYADTFLTINGCDSIIITDLLVHPAYQVLNPQEICAGEIYSIGSSVYSAVGIYSDTFLTIYGCDSIVITDLFVHPVHQVMNPQEICAGGVYTIGGSTYSASGVYTDTLMSSTGCDSIVITDLSIFAPDISITVNGIVLQSNTSGATSYQWVDCDLNHQQIIGANQQTFIPQSNGNYALIIGENGCTDTSACIPVTAVGIAAEKAYEGIAVYPNPFIHAINIDFLRSGGSSIITVFTLTGKKVFSGEFLTGGETVQIPLDLDPGVYILQYIDQQGIQNLKITRR